MWYVSAGQQVICDGCEHAIQSGECCLSDLPEQLPKNVTRNEFRHFHLNCSECKPAGNEVANSCYQVFASQLVTERAQSEVVCLDCGHLILEGEEVLKDFFFVREGANRDDPYPGQGPAALLSALVKGQQIPPTSFAGYSRNTIRKFGRSGLGNGRGSRSFQGAREFYQSSVPGPVRNMGEGAVSQFTKGKQASHIRSVANAPGQTRNPANIVWESAKANQNRGPRNMTRMELVGARATNAADAARIVGKAAARNSGKAAAWTALFEFPVSLFENGICFYRDKKSGRKAAKDVGKDVAAAGAVGGVAAVGTTVAIALGAGPALAAAGPVLVPIGVGIFAFSSGSRILRAWKDGLSMVELNFHAACPDCESDSGCFDSFAHWVSSDPLEETPEKEGLLTKDC